jgi:hypothetical protein
MTNNALRDAVPPDGRRGRRFGKVTFRKRRLNVAAIAADATRGQSLGLHFFAEPSCFAAGIVVASFPWSVDHRIWRPEDPISNGTKVPEHYSIPICAASAASDSGSLQTALSKTLN